jgi:cell division protein FtsI/penicillin-binding protein 2
MRLRPNTVDKVRAGLREVVTAGTANVLADSLVSVAGKTGTAQTSDEKTHAWFSGFFPFEKPRYAICVFLERGGHGSSAVVISKTIIEAMAQEGLVE